MLRNYVRGTRNDVADREKRPPIFVNFFDLFCFPFFGGLSGPESQKKEPLPTIYSSVFSVSPAAFNRSSNACASGYWSSLREYLQ